MSKTEKKIKKLNRKAQNIINRHDLEWEEKYDKIFSDKISKKVFKLIKLDYYDPDTSYEEDVFAFVNALDNWVVSNEMNNT